jgi:hypothetical protein
VVGGFSWAAAVALAGRRTTLRPGDVLAGPPFLVLDDVRSGAELEVDGIGTEKFNERIETKRCRGC